MNKLAVVVIRAYQRYLSPLLGNNCRFQPTCSAYAIQAYTKYGFIKGSYLSLRRLLRCHPFCAGGYDPLK